MFESRRSPVGEKLGTHWGHSVLLRGHLVVMDTDLKTAECRMPGHQDLKNGCGSRSVATTTVTPAPSGQIRLARANSG